MQAQLVRYVDLRIRRYRAHASHDITELAAMTTRLQAEMWAEVEKAAGADPNAVMATVVTGMNDVLNRQGYTQAARWNRIPIPACVLVACIALFSNFLIGFGARRSRSVIFLIVPLAIAISFLLIADIDSPQGGHIRIVPHNLEALADSLKAAQGGYSQVSSIR